MSKANQSDRPTVSCPPAGRASWCGQLKAGNLLVPVKAYAAASSNTELQLHQLHRKCGKRIEQPKRCPKHGEIPADQIVKGVPCGGDTYVRLSNDEVEQARPIDDKTIRLERFCEPQQLDPIMYSGRCLYLVPDSPITQGGYAALQTAMQTAQKCALGQMVLSNHRQLVIVSPGDDTFILYTLFFPAQLKAAPQLKNGDPPIDRRTVRILQKTIEAASGPVPWSDYVDDSNEKLTALVQAKVMAIASKQTISSQGAPKRKTSKRRMSKRNGRVDSAKAA